MAQKPSKGKAFLEGLRGGVTFGFADELTGATSAALDKLKPLW